jgi:hypothetical protein
MAGLSDDGQGWALPPFKPDDALVTLKRALRDLKLNERGNHFELRGKRVIELSVDGASINARLARRLMLTPEWDRVAVASVADQRKLIDDVKKRLARWDQEE